MAKTRRRKSSSRRRGIISAIYRPVSEVIGAANTITNTSAKTISKIVHASLTGVNKVGKNVTGRADRIIYNVMPRGRKTKRRRRN